MWSILVVGAQNVWYTIIMAKQGREWRKYLFAAIRPVVRAVARCRYGAGTRVYRDIKGPCIVLGNHSYIVDAMLMGAAFVPPLHFVAASVSLQPTPLGRLVSFLAAPIPVNKACMDIGGLRRIMSEAKAGHSIGLYPEGNITIDGSPLPFDRSIAKLVKQLKLPLVLYRTTGGYFSKPKWALHYRRGKVVGAVERVMTAEEVAATDIDALYAIIVQALDVDAYQQQQQCRVPYKGRRKAEGIGRLLYYCPCCNQAGRFVEKGDTFRCQACGHVFTYDDYGYIADSPYPTTVQWNRWQQQLFLQNDPSNYSVAGKLYDCTQPKKPQYIGQLGIDDAKLCIGDKSFDLAKLDGAVLHDANHLLLTENNQLYRFVPDEVGANVLPLLAVIHSRMRRK